MWLGLESSIMSRQVVQIQPKSRIQEAGQWSTGLCECYKDIGDCKCPNVTFSISVILFLCTVSWPSVCVCAGCFALCCLPVFTCKVTSEVGACPCLPLLDCIGCVPPASLAMRASVRERYGIQVTGLKLASPQVKQSGLEIFPNSKFQFQNGHWLERHCDHSSLIQHFNDAINVLRLYNIYIDR